MRTDIAVTDTDCMVETIRQLNDLGGCLRKSPPAAPVSHGSEPTASAIMSRFLKAGHFAKQVFVMMEAAWERVCEVRGPSYGSPKHIVSFGNRDWRNWPEEPWPINRCRRDPRRTETSEYRYQMCKAFP